MNLPGWEPPTMKHGEGSHERPIAQYNSAIIEHLPVAVALLDVQDLRLLQANPLFHSLLDPAWQDERALGHPLTDWLPGAMESGLLEICRTVAQTGQPYRGPASVIPGFARGVTPWDWAIEPVYDAQGHMNSLLFIASPINGQPPIHQQAEQAQAHQQGEPDSRHLAVVEAVARSIHTSLDVSSIARAAIEAIQANFVTCSVSLHRADPVLRMLHLVEIAPVPAGHLARHPVQAVASGSAIPAAHAYKAPELINVEDLQAAFAHHMENNHLLIMSGARGSICIPLWFGDTFEGALTVLFPVPIAAQGPEVQALLGCRPHLAVALAQGRLYRQVEQERLHLQAVLDQVPEGMLIAEAATSKISYANAAAVDLLGIPLQQLLGTPLSITPQEFRVPHEHGQPAFPWQFAVVRALSGETVTGLNAQVVRPDGSRVSTLASSAPLRNASGVVTSAVLVFQDVTDQKRLEQHKQEFLAIASHELRTPVMAILGYADLLRLITSQGKALDAAQTARVLNGIIRQSERLARLVEDLLDLTRIEQAQFTLQQAPHDLHALLSQVIDGQAAISHQHQLHLVLEGIAPADTVVGDVDAERLAQVFNNLLGNAIKYSPQGGTIEVGMRTQVERPNQVLIWVKDQGVGIAASDLPHIFDRYYRASATSTTSRGLGLGLYLVREVINRHGGHVWAESTPGQGSTFYIELPLARK